MLTVKGVYFEQFFIFQVYNIWIPALKAAEEREDVKIIVLTGR